MQPWSVKTANGHDCVHGDCAISAGGLIGYPLGFLGRQPPRYGSLHRPYRNQKSDRIQSWPMFYAHVRTGHRPPHPCQQYSHSANHTGPQQGGQGRCRERLQAGPRTVHTQPHTVGSTRPATVRREQPGEPESRPNDTNARIRSHHHMRRTLTTIAIAVAATAATLLPPPPPSRKPPPPSFSNDPLRQSPLPLRGPHARRPRHRRRGPPRPPLHLLHGCDWRRRLEDHRLRPLLAQRLGRLLRDRLDRRDPGGGLEPERRLRVDRLGRDPQQRHHR